MRVTMLMRIRPVRWASNYYNLFPKTFPNQKPQWDINLNDLRKEYRSLQQTIHPDLNQTNLVHNNDNSNENLGNTIENKSSKLNKAYQTLKDPLLRSQYLLRLIKGVDLTDDNTIVEARDPELLLDVMEVYEEISEITTEDQLKPIKKQVQGNVEQIKKDIFKSFNDMDYKNAITQTIALKYWTNVLQSIKNWSPNKRIELTH